MGFLGKIVKGRLRKKLGINKLQTAVDKIGTQVSDIARKLPNRGAGMFGGGSESTMIGPGTNMPGAITNETTDILGGDINETGVVEGSSFDPSTLNTAENIFGKPMEDSFDRDLGVAGGEGDSAIGLDTEEDTNELV